MRCHSLPVEHRPHVGLVCTETDFGIAENAQNYQLSLHIFAFVQAWKCRRMRENMQFADFCLICDRCCKCMCAYNWRP